MIEITVKMLLDENSSDTKRALAALFSLPNASCICDDPDNSEEDEQAKAQALAILAKQKAEKAARTAAIQNATVYDAETGEVVTGTPEKNKWYKIEKEFN